MMSFNILQHYKNEMLTEVLLVHISFQHYLCCWKKRDLGYLRLRVINEYNLQCLVFTIDVLSCYRVNSKV